MPRRQSKQPSLAHLPRHLLNHRPISPHHPPSPRWRARLGRRAPAQETSATLRNQTVTLVPRRLSQDGGNEGETGGGRWVRFTPTSPHRRRPARRLARTAVSHHLFQAFGRQLEGASHDSQEDMNGGFGVFFHHPGASIFRCYQLLRYHAHDSRHDGGSSHRILHVYIYTIYQLLNLVNILGIPLLQGIKSHNIHLVPRIHLHA